MGDFNDMTPAEWEKWWEPITEGMIIEKPKYESNNLPIENKDRIFDPDYRFTSPVKCEKENVCVRRKSTMFHLYCFICPRADKIEIEKLAGKKVFKYWDEHTRPVPQDRKSKASLK